MVLTYHNKKQPYRYLSKNGSMESTRNVPANFFRFISFGIPHLAQVLAPLVKIPQLNLLTKTQVISPLA